MSVNTILGVPIANIAKINGIPLDNIAKWRGDVLDKDNSPFITEWELLPSGLSITLPLPYGPAYNFTVAWGDGTQSTVTYSNDNNRIHTYSTSGTYQVRITGICEGWSFANIGDKDKIKRVIHWGGGNYFSGFTYLESGFYGCTNLVSIGNSVIKASGTGCADISYIFYLCTNLTTTINKDLLKQHTSLQTCIYSFANCGAYIPNGLFRYNTNVSNFEGTFLGIRTPYTKYIFYSEGEQSTRFFNRSISFDSCFHTNNDVGLSTAPDLWNCNYGYGLVAKSYCFGGTGNNTSTVTNYGDIPSAWK